MTAFARHDLNSITIPAETGGCGQPHEREIVNLAETKRRKDPEAPKFADVFPVDCPLCEPILLSPLHGWAKDPLEVELTPDEVKAKERLENEGSIATQQMAQALGQNLAKMVAAGGVEAS